MRLCLLALLLFMSACSGGRESSEVLLTRSGQQAISPIPEHALYVGCDWIEVFRENDQYFALVDTAARYWLALAPTDPPPGSYIEINGSYPQARYFSLHLYDGQTQSRDALADFEIKADPGGRNPYKDAVSFTALAAGHARFSAQAHFKHDDGTTGNLLFRGPLEGDVTQRRSFIMLRAYLPQAVELPALHLVNSDGSRTALAATPDGEACAAHQQQLRAAYLSPSTENTNIPADRIPYLRKFRGAAGVGEGSFVNRHNAYLYALTQAKAGRVVFIRGRAPQSSRNKLLANLLSPLIQADLRFWSVCQNGLRNYQVPGCIDDSSALLDADGYFNVLISQPEDKPDTLLAYAQHNWLPWGDDERGFPVYRHMLPAHKFSQAIQNIPLGQSHHASMGSYAPQIRYCNSDQLNALARATPQEQFDACDDSDL